jgi:WhiB family transcriptional regulator, redox-sensing transcriptional regulator
MQTPPSCPCRDDWRADAACVGLETEFFFPVGTSGHALDQIARAKAVCERCPVIAQCLEWALRTNQDAGIWGGRSEDERRTMRRSHQRRARKGAND